MSFKNNPQKILNAVLKMTRDPILLIERSLRVCDANPAFQEQVGTTFTSPIPFGDFLFPNERASILQQLATAFEDHAPTHFRSQLLTTDGVSLWFEWTLSYESNLDRILLLGKNITPHRETLSELAAIRSDHNSQQKAEDIFVAKMNHEMRTPLHSILGYAQLLERRKTLSEKDQALISSIRENGKNLLSMIDQIFAHGEKPEQQSITLEKVCIEAMVKNVIDEFRLRSEKKSIQVLLESSEKNLKPVETDAKKLRDVIRNLVDNAVKFTDNGSVRVRINSNDHYASSIDIIDSGRGIEKRDGVDIFDPFEKGCRFDQDCGIGLGLALAKKHCTLMGFQLVIETRESGAHFSILLR